MCVCMHTHNAYLLTWIHQCIRTSVPPSLPKVSKVGTLPSPATSAPLRGAAINYIFWKKTVILYVSYTTYTHGW